MRVRDIPLLECFLAGEQPNVRHILAGVYREHGLGLRGRLAPPELRHQRQHEPETGVHHGGPAFHQALISRGGQLVVAGLVGEPRQPKLGIFVAAVRQGPDDFLGRGVLLVRFVLQ